MPHVPRFHIHTFGCKVNRAESERIAASLLSSGWQQADASSADIALVNTCTVTGEADVKNRKLIRSLLRAGCPHVLVFGCAVQVEAGHYAELGSNVVCESDKSRVVERAYTLVGLPPQVQAPLAPALPDRIDAGFRTRVDVKVQDGCDNACTYCIVHVARGPARSVPADAVVSEVARLAADGVGEVVLVGIDLGAYRSEGLDLAGLLQRCIDETDIARLRISSLEPQNLTDSLVECLARSEGRICRHLHLCLQSGSDKVLAEMARPYTAAQFEEKVAMLKSRVPGIALSTDVIVGFPGETDEDFADTCALVERCGFMRLHVFRYSRRPGTPAAERADQVAPEVMARRSAILRELGQRLAAADARSRVGRCEQVIVERPGRGTSESYHPVRLDAALPEGSLAAVRFTSYDEAGAALVGERV